MLRCHSRTTARAAIVLAACAFGSPASAADVALGMAVKAPATPAYNWTGFYFGANVGYGVTKDPSIANITRPAFGVTDAALSAPTAAEGRLGGIQAGYNWQNGHAVFGIEADIQTTGQTGRNCYLHCLLESLPTVSIERRLHWFGTVRGRIGVANGPVLLFASGGLAYGSIATDMSTSFGGGGAPIATRNTRVGWTAGGGIEAALSGNWTAKVEYLYLDLGNETGATPIFAGAFMSKFNGAFHDHIVRAGVNYRLSASAPANVISGSGPVAGASDDRWQGGYLGVNAGYGVGSNPTSQQVPGVVFFRDFFAAAPTGALGGLQAGYNWQAGRAVIGLESDIQINDQRESACVLACNNGAFLRMHQTLPWFGTTRGRLGYAQGPALFYATGGIAYGQVTMDVAQLLGIARAAHGSQTRTGWTVGAGIEAGLAANWSVKAEYLYVDLGTASANLVDTFGMRTIASDINNHVFRVGANYRFGMPAVSAR